uniref:Uncharacterized protein n=1 Tax=Acrobeloides nanus TaxID=290746 RepID=A0A914DBE7_9BILA
MEKNHVANRRLVMELHAIMQKCMEMAPFEGDASQHYIIIPWIRVLIFVETAKKLRERGFVNAIQTYAMVQRFHLQVHCYIFYRAH